MASMFLKDHDAETQRRMVAAFPEEKRDAAIARAFPGNAPNPGSKTLEAVLADTGAAFTVAKRPLMAVIDAEQAVEVPQRVALVRTDTWAPLGVVGPEYGIVQAADAFAPAGVLLASGEMETSRVQVREGGSVVRLTGLLGATVLSTTHGPDVLAHFASFECHFGTMQANTADLKTLRLICSNGATSAKNEGGVRIVHNRNAEATTREAYAALFSLTEAALAEAAAFQRMAATSMSLWEYRAFAAGLMDAVRGVMVEADKHAKRAAELYELERLFISGIGNHGETLWDAYNSVTEWIDHKRERVRNSRLTFEKAFESANYGAGRRMKAAARRLLTR